PGEVDGGEDPCQWHPEHEADGSRDERGADRQPQRPRHQLAGGDVGSCGPRHPPEDTDERRGEERDRDEREEEHRERDPAPPWVAAPTTARRRGRGHRTPKPWRTRTARPSSDRTNSTNARAASGDCASAATATG